MSGSVPSCMGNVFEKSSAYLESNNDEDLDAKETVESNNCAFDEAFAQRLREHYPDMCQAWASKTDEERDVLSPVLTVQLIYTHQVHERIKRLQAEAFVHEKPLQDTRKTQKEQVAAARLSHKLQNFAAQVDERQDTIIRNLLQNREEHITKEYAQNLERIIKSDLQETLRDMGEDISFEGIATTFGVHTDHDFDEGATVGVRW